MLEELLQRGCRGVFTTHLHEMFELPLRLDAVDFLRMDIQIKDDDGSWVPTWRLASGRCIDSLAIHAALQAHVLKSTRYRDFHMLLYIECSRALTFEIVCHPCCPQGTHSQKHSL